MHQKRRVHPLEVKVAEFNTQLAEEQDIKRANAPHLQ